MGTALAQAQASLTPYIRSRKEASHIRQVLAAHLDSQINYAAGHSQVPVSSLVHDSTSVKTTSGTIPGCRKEYLKALRANIKARREYERVCNTSTLRNGDLTSRDVVTGTSHPARIFSGNSDQLDGYLALIKQRQRHERLRILKDYVDKLEQKSAAATSYLNQSNPQIPALYQVSVETVKSSASGTQELNLKPLKDLIKGLEQAVLRAKVQLNNEKQLLQQVKSGNLKERDGVGSVSREAQILQALSATRNELIKWIEEELGKTGDSGPQYDHETHRQSRVDAKETIEEQLITVKAQYDRYVEVRRTFIDAIAETVEPVSATNPTEKKETDVEDSEAESTPSTTWIVSPYLRELQLISNEQKSSIQQKSHLTVSLAKQHKETVQLFDRLAHESHLLPAYPVKPTGRNARHFDIDEMAGKEMPGAAHRARAWTYAGESASAATKESVLALTEEGEAAIESARHMLSTLELLLGRKNGAAESGAEHDIWTSEMVASGSGTKAKAQSDIWAVLDGNLGALQRGEDKALS